MKQLLFALTVYAFLLFSCSGNPEKEETAAAEKEVIVKSPVDDMLEKKAALKEFDALEKIFNNDNYLIVEGKDSSYTYFSRLNKYFIKVSSYKMVRGDSDQLIIDTIQIDSNNKVIWNWKGVALSLNKTTDYASEWKIIGADSALYQFTKIDNNQISLSKPNHTPLKLQKTITLSDFLVRSFYDFQHGTRLAFDKRNFTRKK